MIAWQPKRRNEYARPTFLLVLCAIAVCIALVGSVL